MLMAKKKNLSTLEEQEVRAKVSPVVYAFIEQVKADNGLDHKQIVARLLTFLHHQEKTVRAAILGQLDNDKEVKKIVLERLRLIAPSKSLEPEDDVLVDVPIRGSQSGVRSKGA